MTRWAGLAMLIIGLLSAACSKDKTASDQARVTATPSPSPAATAATEAGCFAGLRTYRYTGTVDLKLPPSLGGSNFRDIAVSGAQVSPDRNQTRLVTAQGTFELITIDGDAWVRSGSGAWEKNPRNLGPQFSINPRDICRTSPAELERLGVRPQRETINGTSVLKYTATKEQLSRANAGFGGAGGLLTALFDDVVLTLWVSEQERWPVRLDLQAEQTGTDAISLRAGFTISDFNKSDIAITAPN